MTWRTNAARVRDRIIAERWDLLPIRLMIGFGFAAHGYTKLARGPELFATIVSALGLPAPLLTAWVVSLLELVGGTALMLGAAVIPFSIPLAATMLTAMFGVHLRYGFSAIKLKSLTPSGAEFGPPGYETNLLYIAGLLALCLGGSSPLSVARWLDTRRKRIRGTATE